MCVHFSFVACRDFSYIYIFFHFIYLCKIFILVLVLVLDFTHSRCLSASSLSFLDSQISLALFSNWNDLHQKHVLFVFSLHRRSSSRFSLFFYFYNPFLGLRFSDSLWLSFTCYFCFSKCFGCFFVVSYIGKGAKVWFSFVFFGVLLLPAILALFFRFFLFSFVGNSKVSKFQLTFKYF